MISIEKAVDMLNFLYYETNYIDKAHNEYKNLGLDIDTDFVDLICCLDMLKENLWFFGDTDDDFNFLNRSGLYESSDAEHKEKMIKESHWVDIPKL